MVEFRCLLLGVKRTLIECSLMSAFDPKRTCYPPKSAAGEATLGRPNDPSLRQFHSSNALSSSCPFLADAGWCPGNCSGMEKRLERQAHSRSIGRGGCGLPVETGAMA